MQLMQLAWSQFLDTPGRACMHACMQEHWLRSHDRMDACSRVSEGAGSGCNQKCMMGHHGHAVGAAIHKRVTARVKAAHVDCRMG